MKINCIPIKNNGDIESNFTTKKILDYKSGIFINNKKEDNQIVIYYFKVFEDNLLYANWLDWIHKISQSMNNGYNMMKDTNNLHKDNLTTKSDIHCFKALFPLLMHMPHNYINNISTMAFYDIFRIFCNRRDNDTITKDYARNIYSRLKTSIHEEFNLKNMNLFDLMQNHNKLIKFDTLDDIGLQNTKLKEPIIIENYKDDMLDIILKQYHSPINL